MAEANLRHHDAVRAVDAADEEDRQRIVTDWLASPEAERQLEQALLDLDALIEIHTPNAIGTLTGSDNDAGRADYARAILAALREQEAGK